MLCSGGARKRTSIDQLLDSKKLIDLDTRIDLGKQIMCRQHARQPPSRHFTRHLAHTITCNHMPSHAITYHHMPSHAITCHRNAIPCHQVHHTAISPSHDRYWALGLLHEIAVQQVGKAEIKACYAHTAHGLHQTSQVLHLA
jgi:hypothetical protein